MRSEISRLYTSGNGSGGKATVLRSVRSGEIGDMNVFYSGLNRIMSENKRLVGGLNASVLGEGATSGPGLPLKGNPHSIQARSGAGKRKLNNLT